MTVLSTKLLRPLPVGELPGVELHCHTCSTACHGDDAARAGWYGDFALVFAGQSITQGVYCPEHAMLEDMDPDWPANQNTLYRVPVSRNMLLKDVTSLDQIFTEPVQYPTLEAASKARSNVHLKGSKWWVRLPVTMDFAPWQYVDHQPALQPVFDNLLYGAEGDYYFEITFRQDDLALVSIKYEKILGSRFICLVPKAEVIDFFWKKTHNCRR